MPFLEGLKKAPDLHLNQSIDLKVDDMYFVFKARIASIYVFISVQYESCNHDKFDSRVSVGAHIFEARVLILCNKWLNV